MISDDSSLIRLNSPNCMADSTATRLSHTRVKFDITTRESSRTLVVTNSQVSICKSLHRPIVIRPPTANRTRTITASHSLAGTELHQLPTTSPHRPNNQSHTSQNTPTNTQTHEGGTTAQRFGGGGRGPFQVYCFHATPTGIMLHAEKFAGDR